MKQIAFNATILDERPTGLGIYAVHVLREIAVQMPVYVITSGNLPFQNENIKIIKAPVWVRSSQKFGPIFRIAWLNTILPGLLKKQKIDILVNLTQHGFMYDVIPQITLVPDLLPVYFPNQYRTQSLYYQYALPQILKHSDRVLTYSDNNRRDIVRYYKYDEQKITVTGCGFRQMEKGNPRIIKNPYILMVGATFAHKNIRFVLPVIAQDLFKDYCVVIAGGRAEYISELKKEAETLRIADRCVFYDYVNHDDMPALYEHADVLVYPSLYEGFGIPPLEAMQFSVPVCCSNRGSIPEVCGDAAEFFDPEDARSLSAALENALFKTDDKKITSGIRQTEKHSWEKSAQKILEAAACI